MTQAAGRLSVAHVHARGRRVAVVRGDVALDTAPALFAELARATAPRDDTVAVDLCDATAVDADGMALLASGVRALLRRRREVVLVCPAGPVRDSFERTGLARRVTLLDDADALDRAASLPAPAAAVADEGAEPAAGNHHRRLATPERRATLLAEAIVTIERRHADPTLALDGVAREIATSSRQLQRVFAEHAGGAFRAELAAVRMEHAAALLQATRLPISEIAPRVGYRHAAQFAKAFRRHHGVSPSGLRRAAG